MTTRPLHPLFFGAYPALFVFVHNEAQLTWMDLPVPLAACLLFALCVWAACFVFQRDARLAAVAATPWLFAVFGHRFALAALPASVAASAAARLGVAAGLLACAACAQWWLVRRLRDDAPALDRVNGVLGVVSLCLLALPLMQLALAAASAPGDAPAPSASDTSPLVGARSGAAPLPDIYYVVLDGFGSPAVLERVFEHDASPFVAALEAHGFVLPEPSRANYPRTVHALASALNFAYLSPAAGRLADVPHGLGPLVHGIRQNKLMRWLAGVGYTTYSFESGYAASELRDADHYLARGVLGGAFAREVFAWTAAPDLLRALGGGPYAEHRARITYVLETLPRLAGLPGPKFVFAHLLAPHPPFVFDAQGDAVANTHAFELYDGNHYLTRASRDDYVRGYRAQVAFMSGAIEGVVAGILAASSEPPIIVLQGDHGPGLGFHHEDLARTDLDERLSILNALLVPDAALRAEIQRGITPVNTFRVILADLFPGAVERAGLARVPDRSFYTRDSRPYEFIDVTNRLERGGEAALRRAP